MRSASSAMTQGAILIVDKPVGLNCRAASAKALDKLKTYFPTDPQPTQKQPQQHKKRRSSASGHVKMGHAGTLDPMATGCLPVLLGQATKLQDHLPIHNKRYLAHLRLGVRTSTDDADGEVVEQDAKFSALTEAGLAALQHAIAARFPLGKLKQTPPIYSAIHINGQRAYDLARQGEVPVMPEREIELLAFRVSFVDERTVEMDVECGTGTYIRTLGVDLAKDVFNTVGHLVQLRRVASGPYQLAERRDVDAQGEVRIVRLIEFRDAVASCARMISVRECGGDDGQVVLVWLKTGKTKLLYGRLHDKQLLSDRPDRVAFETGDGGGGVIALFQVEYPTAAEGTGGGDTGNIKAICHFNLDQDLIPKVEGDAASALFA